MKPKYYCFLKLISQWVKQTVVAFSLFWPGKASITRENIELINLSWKIDKRFASKDSLPPNFECSCKFSKKKLH